MKKKVCDIPKMDHNNMSMKKQVHKVMDAALKKQKGSKSKSFNKNKRRFIPAISDLD